MNVQLCPCTVYTFQAFFCPPSGKKYAINTLPPFCGGFFLEIPSETEKPVFPGFGSFLLSCSIVGGIVSACIRAPPCPASLVPELLHQITAHTLRIIVSAPAASFRLYFTAFLPSLPAR